MEVAIQAELTKRVADEDPFLDRYGPMQVSFRVDKGEIFTVAGRLGMDGFINFSSRCQMAGNSTFPSRNSLATPSTSTAQARR